MQKLIIIGAGGLGRELLDYAEHCISAHTVDFIIGGFLDDTLQSLTPYGIEYPILGTTQKYMPNHNDVFICGIGDSVTRMRLISSITQKGGNFINLIHPTAIVSPRAKIGIGLILAPHSYISNNAVIKDFCTINTSSGIGHDSTLGEGCTLSSYCEVTGNCKIGKQVFMGSHACIIPGIEIGDYSKISAGSVVMKNVPPNHTVFGNPARILSKTSSQ